MAKQLRLNRVEDAEIGYNAMVAAYSNDLKPKPEGLQKIYSILSRTNPKLSTLKPETVLDATFISENPVERILNPDCAVKDLWSKEREKKDKRSSGLG